MSDTDPGPESAVSAEEVCVEPVEPIPDDVAHDALRGDPEAEAAVAEGWEKAKSMDVEAPSG